MLVYDPMTMELKWIVVAAIVICALVVKRSSDVQAEVRERFGRLARQIERGRTRACAKPGDIVLTQGHTFVSSAIRFCTRGLGESRTQVNHVAIVVAEGSPPAEATIIEALHEVKRHSTRKGYGNGRSDVAIYRPTSLTEDEKETIVKAAKAYHGKSYGYGKIILHVLDSLLLGFFVFRKLARVDEEPICSWLVAHSYNAAGTDFGVSARAATPDDIWDFVKNHPQPRCTRPSPELGPVGSVTVPLK